MRALILVIAVSFVVGCSSSMQKLEPEAIATIRPFRTTRADVERMFGAPRKLIFGASGKSVAEYYAVRRPTSSVFAQSMSVLYDNRGIVMDVVHTDVHKPIDETQNGRSVGSPLVVIASAIKPGMEIERLEKIFGSPDFLTFTPEGERVIEWYYVKTERFHPERNIFNRLIVVADRAGYVRAFRTATSKPNAR